MAARNADGVFSMTREEASWRPRWAIGRAVSHSRIGALSGHFERGLDLDRGIERQGCDADGGAGMTALVAEGCDHQVGGAVHHLGAVGEAYHRIDEAAESHHAGDLVEIAESGLELRQDVDRAGARRLLAVFDGHRAPKLALGYKLALGVEAELARNHHEIAGANERHVIGDWRSRLRQFDAQVRKLLFDGSGH